MRPPARCCAGVGVSLLVAFAAVGAGLVTAGRAGPEAVGVTRTQADEIVRAHNAWRERVGVLPLHWAPDLATRAQTRAAYLAAHGCVISHGRLPGDVGENLFRASPLHYEAGNPDELFVVSATQVVDTWGAQSVDYNPVDGTCARNRQCAHYTQIVWPTTTDVGCGMAICPTLGQVWVCNYRPKGNISLFE